MILLLVSRCGDFWGLVWRFLLGEKKTQKNLLLYESDSEQLLSVFW